MQPGLSAPPLYPCSDRSLQPRFPVEDYDLSHSERLAKPTTFVGFKLLTEDQPWEPEFSNQLEQYKDEESAEPGSFQSLSDKVRDYWKSSSLRTPLSVIGLSSSQPAIKEVERKEDKPPEQPPRESLSLSSHQRYLQLRRFDSLEREKDLIQRTLFSTEAEKKREKMNAHGINPNLRAGRNGQSGGAGASSSTLPVRPKAKTLDIGYMAHERTKQMADEELEKDCRPPKEWKVPKLNQEIAIQYLLDMHHIRPPQRRIQLNKNHWFSPLIAYKIIKSKLWSHFLYFCVLLLLALAIWEPPTEHNDDSDDDDKLDPVQPWILCLVIVISLVVAADVFLRVRSHDPFYIGVWCWIVSVCCLLYSINSIWLLSNPNDNVGYYSYRILRISRPLFLFHKSRDLKKLSRSIVRGLPALAEVGSLIVLFIVVFGFIGHYLFWGDSTKRDSDTSDSNRQFGKNPYFKSFGESMYSLMVLQTTANFPDVMLPSYTANQYTVYFFVLYNVLGIFYLMALVLAIIYNNYFTQVDQTMRKIKFHRDQASREAFRMLTYHQLYHHDLIEDELQGGKLFESSSEVVGLQTVGSKLGLDKIRSTLRVRPSTDAYNSSSSPTETHHSKLPGSDTDDKGSTQKSSSMREEIASSFRSLMKMGDNFSGKVSEKKRVSLIQEGPEHLENAEFGKSSSRIKSTKKLDIFISSFDGESGDQTSVDQEGIEMGIPITSQLSLGPGGRPKDLDEELKMMEDETRTLPLQSPISTGADSTILSTSSAVLPDIAMPSIRPDGIDKNMILSSDDWEIQARAALSVKTNTTRGRARAYDKAEIFSPSGKTPTTPASRDYGFDHRRQNPSWATNDILTDIQNPYTPVVYYDAFEEIVLMMRPDLYRYRRKTRAEAEASLRTRPSSSFHHPSLHGKPSMSQKLAQKKGSVSNEKPVDNLIYYMYLAICDADSYGYDDGIDAEHWVNIHKFLDISIGRDVSASKRLNVARKINEKAAELQSKKTLTSPESPIPPSKPVTPDALHLAAAQRINTLKSNHKKKYLGSDNAKPRSSNSGGGYFWSLSSNRDSMKNSSHRSDNLTEIGNGSVTSLDSQMELTDWERFLIFRDSLNQWWLSLRLCLISFWEWEEEYFFPWAPSDLQKYGSVTTESDMHGGDSAAARATLAQDIGSVLAEATSKQRELSAAVVKKGGKILKKDNTQSKLKDRSTASSMEETDRSKPGKKSENPIPQLASVTDFTEDEFMHESITKEHSVCEFNSIVLSTDLFITSLILISTLLVILELYVKIPEWINQVVVWIFMMEVVCKILAWGLRGYFEDTFNVFDFLVSTLTFIFEVVIGRDARFLLILRMARILRMLRAFTRFKVILRTTKAVLSSFTALFVLLGCVSYAYAILGMELFHGDVTKKKVNQWCEESDLSNDDSPFTTDFWCGISQTYYYDNNFNSFSRAMVVQMELITVNNWHIITEMFVKANHNRWIRIYFIIVYLTAVVVVMNVLTAFVLEAFMSQYQKAREESNDNNRLSQKKLKSESDNAKYFAKAFEDEYNEEHKTNEMQIMMYRAMRLGVSDEELIRVWKFDRKLSKALFYEQMYPELFDVKPKGKEDQSDEAFEIGRLDTHHRRLSSWKMLHGFPVAGTQISHGASGAGNSGMGFDLEPFDPNEGAVHRGKPRAGEVTLSLIEDAPDPGSVDTVNGLRQRRESQQGNRRLTREQLIMREQLAAARRRGSSSVDSYGIKRHHQSDSSAFLSGLTVRSAAKRPVPKKKNRSHTSGASMKNNGASEMAMVADPDAVTPIFASPERVDSAESADDDRRRSSSSGASQGDLFIRALSPKQRQKLNHRDSGDDRAHSETPPAIEPIPKEAGGLAGRLVVTPATVSPATTETEVGSLKTVISPGFLSDTETTSTKGDTVYLIKNAPRLVPGIYSETVSVGPVDSQTRTPVGTLDLKPTHSTVIHEDGEMLMDGEGRRIQIPGISVDPRSDTEASREYSDEKTEDGTRDGSTHVRWDVPQTTEYSVDQSMFTPVGASGAVTPHFARFDSSDVEDLGHGFEMEDTIRTHVTAADSIITLPDDMANPLDPLTPSHSFIGDTSYFTGTASGPSAGGRSYRSGVSGRGAGFADKMMKRGR